jgi:hypothetical protein
LCSRILEHNQFPFRVTFIEPEDVQTSVSAAGLDVSVVRAVPLIERFENVDLPPAESKSPGHGHRDG